jgi:hypothetical protein
MKIHDLEDLNLHVTIAWAAVNDVLENPNYMSGMHYDDFYSIYADLIMELKTRKEHGWENLQPPQRLI